MKRFGKPLIFALYFAAAAAFCVIQYLLWRGSFEEVVPYEHSFSLTEPSEPVYLDLNAASAAALAKLPGVSRPLADNIVAYREEIGGFTGFQQLLDVSGMPEQLYLALGEYLYLTPAETQPAATAETQPAATAATPPPLQTEMPETTEMPTEAPTELHLDLNTATLEELCLLPEIGEVTAAAIVEYRNACGGFFNRQQLLEVSGIGEATLAKIMPYLYLTNEQPMPVETEPPVIQVPPDPVEPVSEFVEITEIMTETVEIPIINLNTATLEELMLLPNCDEELAENILALRDGIVVFRNVLELLYTEGITDELYISWEPYLAVDDEGNHRLNEPASE